MLLSMLLAISAPVWELRAETDAITDRRDELAILRGQGARLAIGCTASSAGAAGVVVFFDRLMSSSGQAGVSVRFDADPPQRMLAQFNGRSVQLMRAENARAVAEAARQNRRIVVQAHDFSDQARTAIFEPASDSSPVQSALTQCGPFVDL